MATIRKSRSGTSFKRSVWPNRPTRDVHIFFYLQWIAQFPAYSERLRPSWRNNVKNFPFLDQRGQRNRLNSFIGSSALCKTLFFFRGVFRIRPPMPRCSTTVHVRLVLDCLCELGPSDCLALNSLTFKTVILMALLSAQRYQTLNLIEVQNISFSSSSITLIVPAHLKHSRPRCQNR